MTLTLWRSLFSLTIHASARFPRLVPVALVEYVDRRFYGACLAETLRRPMSREQVERKRRSFAFGQVAMHNPSVTREIVDAVADTIPEPSESWACLAGDMPDHDAGTIDDADLVRDLHDGESWRCGPPQRKVWEA